MKEINAAYEEITEEPGQTGAAPAARGYAVILWELRPGLRRLYGGYTGYAGYGGGYGQSSSSVRLQQVRIAIQTGDLSRAEATAGQAMSDHNAEWNFLKGAVCYRRGWMDEAKRYYQTACQMDPGNRGVPAGAGLYGARHPDGVPPQRDLRHPGLRRRPLQPPLLRLGGHEHLRRAHYLLLIFGMKRRPSAAIKEES